MKTADTLKAELSDARAKLFAAMEHCENARAALKVRAEAARIALPEYAAERAATEQVATLFADYNKSMAEFVAAQNIAR